MQTLPSQREMYEALVQSDRSYDGIFFVGVRTTGIFCRPTCRAKKPRPENVEFFTTAAEALHAGYRPCRRCHPLDNGHRSPEWISALLQSVDRAPTARIKDADLRAMSIDPTRTRRYFKQHYGMTFHAYHRARRLGLALSDVRRGRELSRVAVRHGYNSPSGFRYTFARIFGAAPAARRDARCVLARWFETPLGAMLALATDEGLCLLEFVDRRSLETQITVLRKRLELSRALRSGLRPHTRSGGYASTQSALVAIVPGRNRHLDGIADELARYFDGTLARFTVPLVLPGTPFQIEVWGRLRAIPYGKTLTYSALADELGRPGACRAVGRANGDNRIAFVIPCHRVVRSDGTLCGYGGGLWRKKWLLEHERKGAKARCQTATR